MKDLIANLLETSKERLKNPFVGAFLISFVAINWRVFWIILFSDVKVEDRIIYVQDFYISAEYGLLYPLIVALVYVIVLPYITWGLDLLVEKSTVERKRMAITQQVGDIKGKQELAIEEAKLEDAKASFRDKADLNKRIELLQNQLNERERLIAKRDEEIQSLHDEIEVITSPHLERPSKIDAQNEEGLSEQYEKFKSSDLHKYFLQVGTAVRKFQDFPTDLNDIIKEKFLATEIVKEYREDMNLTYNFTDKGRYFWKLHLNETPIDKNGEVPIDYNFS